MIEKTNRYQINLILLMVGLINEHKHNNRTTTTTTTRKESYPEKNMRIFIKGNHEYFEDFLFAIKMGQKITCWSDVPRLKK